MGERRDAWLQWTAAGYEQYEALHQPPYADLAIETRGDGRLIGLCGFVPSMGPFGLIPGLADGIGDPHRFRPEVGLYWELSPGDRGRGYATEAGAALIAYGFGALRLGRIVATTTHENLASQAVMRRLGMRIEVNPEPEPEWFQVVAVALFAQGA